ncbi:MAG TPA: hypothetical protein VEK57_10790 [Thermoanaerobaculia bacterium]|nr:hypothetical protein [Thermoanaerobaculia bacterium]
MMIAVHQHDRCPGLVGQPADASRRRDRVARAVDEHGLRADRPQRFLDGMREQDVLHRAAKRRPRVQHGVFGNRGRYVAHQAGHDALEQRAGAPHQQARLTGEHRPQRERRSQRRHLPNAFARLLLAVVDGGAEEVELRNLIGKPSGVMGGNDCTERVGDDGQVPRGIELCERPLQRAEVIVECVFDVGPGRASEAEEIDVDHPSPLRQLVEAVIPIAGRALQTGDKDDRVAAFAHHFRSRDDRRDTRAPPARGGRSTGRAAR